MRRLAITSLCAIALLSGCSKDVGPRVVAGRGPPDVSLPCLGKDVDTGKWKLTNKNGQTVVFHTDGRCDLSKLYFDTPDPQSPPGFSKPVVNHNDDSISYTYDGRDIPDPGYTFHYVNDYSLDGNGIGIIK